jgi:hypothetical protein
VEIKTLEGAPDERMDRAIKERALAGDWPTFLGTWPISSVLKHLPDAPEFLEKLIERLSRPIVTHLKKGNSQLESYNNDSVRNRSVSILILINDDHPEYDPDAVGTILSRELEKTKNGLPRYDHIDAIIYLSERHAFDSGSHIAFPAVVAEGRVSSEQNIWKLDVVYFVTQRWASWLGRPFQGVADQGDISFTEVEPVPEQMHRHERWSLEYRRNRYMETWDDDRIRDEWDIVTVGGLLAFHKYPPIQLPPAAIEALLVKLTHLRDEAAIRGLSLDYFKPDGDRLRAAAASLPFGAAVADWVIQELSHLGEDQPAQGSK